MKQTLGLLVTGFWFGFGALFGVWTAQVVNGLISEGFSRMQVMWQLAGYG